MRNFREYDIWKEGIQLVTETYAICEQLPKREQFNIRDT